MYLNRWDQCSCVENGNGAVEDGLMVDRNCPMLYVYVAVMFIGFFLGNLFFMTTMMVVLRCVYDDQRVLALSLASCLTNLLGFIPAPIIFGLIIDGTCTIWHSNCDDRGHCVVYDHDQFRIHLHLWSAVIQIGAVLAVLLCYLVSRRRILPEEEEEDQVYSIRQ